MEELKYHYSNPKFDGLPWPATKADRRVRKGKCVKIPYSQQEAQKETAILRKEAPEMNWYYKFCELCGAHHICREK